MRLISITIPNTTTVLNLHSMCSQQAQVIFLSEVKVKKKKLSINLIYIQRFENTMR